MVKIGNKAIGKGEPVYLIAEVGANHGRDKSNVFAIIEQAAEAGFDAVKFQTYDPLDVFSATISTGDVGFEGLYGKRPWWEVARDEILMPREWFADAFACARSNGLHAFSTVHSLRDAEFILKFDPPALKIASIDVSHLPFLREVPSLGLPVFLSTGMHHLGEIEEAVNLLNCDGNRGLVLLHCVSNYPPKPEDMNLRNIPMLEKAFGLPVGLSNHSPANYTDFAAVALGARVVEKHVTMDRRMKGPDHIFSQDPAGMADLVAGVREAEKALGEFQRKLSANEMKARRMARRSIVARTDIRAGETLSAENLKIARPGSGLHPRNFDLLLGRTSCRDIQGEELISWDMVW
jgi:sialic acid synthase SpsE